MSSKPSDLEVKAALAHILSEALLEIRLRGALGDHKRCEIEADHVHNLPSLLLNLSDDLLAFYYQVERKQYLAQSGGRYPDAFNADWDTLAKRLQLSD